MTPNSGRAIEIFTEAIQLSVGERADFLDRACAGDEGLRRKIEALLSSNDRAGKFMEQPAAGEIGAERAEAVVGEKPGDQLDRYRLLKQIGEGGCGVVFVAEQEHPVRRRVALKVVKPGMDSKSVIARFEAERQALALMDHPNIAHVFDAGATRNGRPYFVMELVDGVKITEYCDQHSLPITARLELFVEVCDAIQHAHQKGIIHRDIKPSNILVTTRPDGKPEPKVIDFGIAKATMGQQLTDKTIFTAREMLIGTPAYMSPEQAALTSSDVDTRSDIYSLGVLLYELLTGTTPFDTQELLKAGFDEVRRVIRDQEPARPSTRLSTMIATDLLKSSKLPGAEVSKLVRQMRGDLDWIVMKALEKDRARRYATANGLAMDINRFLSGEAVLARPPSAGYKFRKLVVRNRLVFSGLALIFVLLVTSLIATTRWLVIKNREQALMSQQLELARVDRLGWELLTQGKYTDAEQSFVKAVAMRQQLPGAEPISVLECSVFVLLYQKEQRLDKIKPFLTESVGFDLLSRPAYQSLYQYTVHTLARAGQWNDADALAIEYCKANPTNPLPYHMRAPLLVAKNDVEGYRRLCGEIISQFGNTTDPYTADKMAKDCLILPSSGVDLNTVATLADAAVSHGSNSSAYIYFKFCKSLAEYRLGHYEEALNWAHLAADQRISVVYAGATAIVAMCEFRLNQLDKARAALAECNKTVDELPKLEQGDLGDDWGDSIIAKALYSEAKWTLDGRSSDAAPPAKLHL